MFRHLNPAGAAPDGLVGQAPRDPCHWHHRIYRSRRSDNLSIYKAFTHQHLGEVNETLKTLAPSYSGEMNFVPVRGDFARGILASVYFDCDLPEEAAVQIYKDYYKNEPFVHVIDSNPDMKMVVNQQMRLECPETRTEAARYQCDR